MGIPRIITLRILENITLGIHPIYSIPSTTDSWKYYLGGNPGNIFSKKNPPLSIELLVHQIPGNKFSRINPNL